MSHVAVLNAHQQRHVTAVLREIEKRLLESEALLTDTSAQPVLVQWENDIPDEQAERLLLQIRVARATVAQLADALQLKPVGQRRWPAVRAARTAAWADAEDLQPHRLCAYGELSAESARTWDALLEPLVRQLNALVDFATGAALRSQ